MICYTIHSDNLSPDVVVGASDLQRKKNISNPPWYLWFFITAGFVVVAALVLHLIVLRCIRLIMVYMGFKYCPTDIVQRIKARP